MKKLPTFFTHRAIIALIPVLLLLNGCVKKSDPDPRDNYIGTYNVTSIYISKNTTLGTQSSGSSNASITVTKGSSGDQLIFQDLNDKYNVTISGSSFTINPYNSNQKINGNTYAFAVTGDGSFNSKNISFIEILKGTISNNNYVQTSNISGNRP